MLWATAALIVLSAGGGLEACDSALPALSAEDDERLSCSGGGGVEDCGETVQSFACELFRGVEGEGRTDTVTFLVELPVGAVLQRCLKGALSPS